jgi:hypothetical protein
VTANHAFRVGDFEHGGQIQACENLEIDGSTLLVRLVVEPRVILLNVFEFRKHKRLDNVIDVGFFSPGNVGFKHGFGSRDVESTSAEESMEDVVVVVVWVVDSGGYQFFFKSFDGCCDFGGEGGHFVDSMTDEKTKCTVKVEVERV